jgi:hypothetical protein
VRVDRAVLPPLADLGGERSGRRSSWRLDPARKLITSVVACRPGLPHLPSPDARGGKGRRRWAWVRLTGSRRQRDLMKLKMRLIPSDGEEHRRYPWPRGPHRTSRVPALRSFLFLQAVESMRRISDLFTVIHPDGEPSGVVPGVAANGRCSRSWRSSGGDEGPDCYLAPRLGSFL